MFIQNLEEDVGLLHFIDRAKTLEIGDIHRSNSQFLAFDVGIAELQTLSRTNGLLNDVCMNGIPKLLHELFVKDPEHQIPAERCAIFSTYDLYRIRYRASDAELWRSTNCHKFWEKNVWIIPIHREAECHWVLAVLYLQDKEIHLFDSLAGKVSWNHDIQVLNISIN